MTYAALAALTGIERMRPRIEVIARAVDSVLSQQAGPMQVAAEQNYERVVFLGSHVLRGLAREAALKLLELTDGAVISAYESPMGFRHGPKTIVNERTLVVVFLSNHPHTRQYDLDVLDELRRDATAARVLAVSAQRDGARDPADCVHVPHLERADDVELLFPYIAAPQLLAFHESLRRGLSPDNPNRSGTVNRVVQGVRIHAVR
jgi:tagatose-6-phosphate ketose/aldose isomerase